MGNIQEVKSYQRVPIFRSRSPGVRSKIYTNQPYGRTIAKSVYTMRNTHRNHSPRIHPSMINSVIRYDENNQFYQPLSTNNLFLIDNQTPRRHCNENHCFRERSFCRKQRQPFPKQSHTPKAQIQEHSFQLPERFAKSSFRLNPLHERQNFNHQEMSITPKHCQYQCQCQFQNQQNNLKIQAISRDEDPCPTTRKKQGNSEYFIKTQRKVTKEASFEQSIQQQSLNAFNQNRSKCEEIIRKVKNFNDFLNEVKRKLKSDISNANANQSEQSFNQTSMETQNRSILMSIKLENEKIQLEKYRKLVSRQLSKQHSISSIDIEPGKNDMEKLIRINYDSNTGNTFESENKREKEKEREKLSKKQSKPNRVRSKYQEVSRKMQELGRVLNEQENSLTERMGKISSLMGRLEGVNEIHQQNNMELANFLKDESESQN